MGRNDLPEVRPRRQKYYRQHFELKIAVARRRGPSLRAATAAGARISRRAA